MQKRNQRAALKLIAPLLLAIHGVVAQLPSCNFNSTALTPQKFPNIDGAHRVRVDYGPFTVPSKFEEGGQRSFTCAPSPPCTDCTVVFMQADLSHLDGQPVDDEEGLRLHHSMFQNMGRRDPTCPQRKGERFFSSGNERTPVDFTSNGLNQYGYYFDLNDTIAFFLEVSNTKDEQKVITLTLTLEYIPSQPASFKKLRPYWLNIAGCESTEMTAQMNSYSTYTSPSIKLGTPGTIIGLGGHLHDGGSQLEVIKNGQENEPFCVSRADYEDGHISNMTICLPGLRYNQDDEFHIIAHYDTNQHPPMINGFGQLEPIMGIVAMYTIGDDVDDEISRVSEDSFYLSPAFLTLLIVSLSVTGAGLTLYLYLPYGKFSISVTNSHLTNFRKIIWSSFSEKHRESGTSSYDNQQHLLSPDGIYEVHDDEPC